MKSNGHSNSGLVINGQKIVSVKMAAVYVVWFIYSNVKMVQNLDDWAILIGTIQKPDLSGIHIPIVQWTSKYQTRFGTEMV
jgi:hypothetical protein